MASTRNVVLWLVGGWVSLGFAAEPKAPPPEAPDPEFLEYLILIDEPGVPLPEPDTTAKPAVATERARPAPPGVKKP